MGKKTSVWLSDDLVRGWHASGVPLAELVRRGLDAGEVPGLEVMLRRIIREELSALPVASPGRAASRYDGYESEPYLEDP